MLTTILATIIVLGVLIFVHELGHFMTAKWVDIEVPRFSIGFGPKILGFRRGETEYVISALPLGGYVKMAGMEEMEQIEGGPVTVNDTVGDAETVEEMKTRPHRPRDFESKSLPARALVISAGVIMNVLFAFVAFSASAAIWGVSADPGTRLGGVTEERLPDEATSLAAIEPGSRITAVNDYAIGSWREFTMTLTRARAGDAIIEFENAPAIAFTLPAADSLRALLISAFEPAVDAPAMLAEVVVDGPAHAAGLLPGDRVVRAGGADISNWQEFVTVVERSPGETVTLVVERNSRRIEIDVIPEERLLDNGLRVGRIGVAAPPLQQHLPRTRPTPLGAVRRGAEQTWDVATLTVDFLGGLFTGRQSARNIGGPIMIGQMSGRFARAGLEEFLAFMAILSINLAILNLLPIPVLDGGHLVFLGVEAVRGRPLSIDQRMRLSQVGFVFIILLMAWAIGNDVLRAFGI